MLCTSQSCSTCQCWRPGFDPWVKKLPRRRKWQPTPVSLLENPMDRGTWWAPVHRVTKESDTTEQLNKTRHVKCLAYCPTQLMFTLLTIIFSIFLREFQTVPNYSPPRFLHLQIVNYPVFVKVFFCQETLEY